MARWQLQEAKQQFSRVVDQAETDGPQVVTRHGKEVAVVIGVEEYRKLRGETDAKRFWEFLRAEPYVDVDLPLPARSVEPMRELDLS